MLTSRKPLPRKRATPRRNEGRVQHGHIKERYNPVPNAAEARHETRLQEMPCIGCSKVGNIECHHTLEDFPAKRWRRDHRYQLPVCPDCHRGPQGIHGIGNEAKWAETVGLRCTGDIAQELWALSEEIERNAA